MPTTRSDAPTIDDVATHADVSIATVSRVINRSGETAAATRDRVLASIDELGYRPNRTAKSLAEGDTKTIAVAVPTFTTPFHNELLKGIRSRLKGVDADLLLCDLDWAAPAASLTSVLERGAMDGLLAAGLPAENGVEQELRTVGGPAVLVGRRSEQIDSFYWDDTKGAYRAAEHLIERGHPRVGMITTHRESPIRNARIRGYEDALRDAGIEPRGDWVATGSTEKHAGFSEESGYEAMEDLLDVRPRPTAVFASSDVQAIGAWQALRHAGLDVPGDVAMIGYDDIKVSRFIGLSSVAQNMHDIGEAAADRLLRRLRGEDGALVSQLVTPELQIRASSDSGRGPIAPL